MQAAKQKAKKNNYKCNHSFVEFLNRRIEYFEEDGADSEGDFKFYQEILTDSMDSEEDSRTRFFQLDDSHLMRILNAA